MKVLQLCQKLPYPPVDGGCQLMHFAGMGLLKQNIGLKIFSINPSRNRVDVNQLPEDYKRKTNIEWVNVDTSIKPFNILFNLLKKESYFIERFISNDFSSGLINLLKNESFEIIQLEHLYLCKYIPEIRKYSNAKIVLRMQNIEYIIWERYLRSMKNPFTKAILNISLNRLRKFEKSAPCKLDGIVALTQEDYNLVNSFGHKVDSVIIPMGYDYNRLYNYNFDKQHEGKPIIYHLGSMDWLPNSEAVRWFLEKVLKLVMEQEPKAEIIIAGRHMPGWVSNYKKSGIKIIDEVNDPVKFQEDKLVMIVPLLSGSGIRAKIIEGLALGKVIISTSIGAQGIEYVKDENLIIADSPQEFSRQIIMCLRSPDLCKKISNNARELSKNKYHADIVSQKLVTFYKTLNNAYSS